MVLLQFPATVLFMLIFTILLNPKIEEHYSEYSDLKHHF